MTDLACSENVSKLQRLQQLFSSATGDASKAMSGWTGSQITLTLDEVCELPLGEACLDLNLNDERQTMVVLILEGDIGGVMLLTFDEHDGRRLAASLLGSEPGTGAEWSDMEQSALAETGNILFCAYINAITQLIDRPLVPSVPYFVQDYAASVLQQALMAQASGRDSVLVCGTGFHCEHEDLNWRVLFIPSVALRTTMEDALESSGESHTTP
jgi:chemotaxis protein CheC